MTGGIYVSVLADHLAGYVALRQNLGFKFSTQIWALRQFDRVIEGEMARPAPVTRGMVERFLGSLTGLQPRTRQLRLSTIRQFLLYLRQFEPATYIPDRSLDPARWSPRPPHIYTEEEIQALLRAALQHPPRYPSLRWLLYPTLIAFLYATGTRISEALALNLGDLDWKRSVIHIRQTKFYKSRLVPLTTSSCEGVQHYLTARAERGHATTPNAPLFVTRKGGRLPYPVALHNFRRITRMAGLRGSQGIREPRIHDLRHTAAVRRLYLWYREGKDVQALLPALVTYLGHTTVRSTAVYLTATSELLGEASARFEHSYPLDAERQGGSSS